MEITHGSLFTGIGGVDLGFEWAGIETRWQVEIDDYCQKLLSIRFPRTEKFTDVRKVGSHNLEKVDIISGGFPCQDISIAGKGEGIDGKRSGLWAEMHRVISELRPRFAFIENVPMLTIRGGTRVISDLAEIGYDAEWQIVGADDVGAWHRRKRIWIVAYSGCDGRGNLQQRSIRRNGKGKLAQEIDRNTKTVKTSRPSATSKIVSNASSKRTFSTYWAVEPNVGRVAHGIPKRVDRLKGIGNAVVPHIPYIIGKRLKELCQRNQAEKH